MKKRLFALILVSCIFALTACSNKNTSKDKLYKIGMDIVETMNEMIHSEVYCELMGVNDIIVPDMLNAVRENDYRDPIAVYAITIPTMSEFLQHFEATANAELALWNALSPNLKKVIEDRSPVMNVATNLINAQQGSQGISFAALFSASKKVSALKLDKTQYYLYVFDGYPAIVVSFSNSGYVSGNFIFLEADRYSEIMSLFGEVGFGVRKIK